MLTTPDGISVQSADLASEVDELLAGSDVWDMTLPWLPSYWNVDTLRRYKNAGYTFVSATLQDWPPSFQGLNDCVQQFRRLAAPHSDWLAFGASLAEIENGREKKKLVLGLNSQESSIVGTDLSRVQSIYDIGVRHMVLAYNVRNLVADGCAEAADAGLSNLGRQVVREMNRVGIIVDGSHTGRRSTLEAIEISERPVIFSHSGAYGVCAHIRNIHDDQINACAACGGVIGIVGIGAFLGDTRARAESMFRHIDYVVELVGPEHVGIGTDYVENMAPLWAAIRSERATVWPDPTGTQLYDGGCIQPEQLTELVALMLGHGYPSDAVGAILGNNFKRIYSTTSASSEAAGHI